MIMRIKLLNAPDTASVYAAVGAFISTDLGPSSILRVEAFHADSEIGAVVSWDIHPTRKQIAGFRRVWDLVTGLCGVTILHDAPSSLVDKPDLVAFN
jgi:hypothetical protein